MKQIYLPWKLILIFLILTIGAQAQLTIRGKVLNESDGGSPLPGVIVLEKGTNNNTLTSMTGEYSLNVKSVESVLVFSYVGMETKELKASKEVINVSMLLKGNLKELVVTALGVSREKKALGYAVSEVSGADLVRSGEANIIQGLSSKAAGVQIT